jgi:hypothetical protein
VLFGDAFIPCGIKAIESNLELLFGASHYSLQKELNELVSVDTFISVCIDLAADPLANKIRHAHILLYFLKRDILFVSLLNDALENTY